MTTEQFSLDLLGPIILESRDRLARIETRLGAIQDRLEHHEDELNVVSGLAMRATGDRVAWSSLQKQLAKLAARVEVLERGRR
jgi:hypothetical protein